MATPAHTLRVCLQASLTAKHPDDVVIVLAARSPLCKAGKGGFKDMRESASKSFELLTDSLLQDRTSF